MADDAYDELDDGISDAHRLEPRVDEEPDDEGAPLDVDGVADEGRARGDADGVSTPPSASSDQGPWAGLPPELVELAEKKHWTSPAEALKAYQGLEELYGRQNQERDETMRSLEEERKQLLEALTSRQEPEPQAPVEQHGSVLDALNWEEFGEVADTPDHRAFEMFTKAVLPMALEEAEKRIEARIAERYRPIEEFTEQQREFIAFDSEVQQVAAENPEAWEATREKTMEILEGWVNQGLKYEPGHIRIAQHQALLSMVRDGGMGALGQQTPPPPSPPPVADTPPAAPAPPQPAAGELQPLTSTTVIQEPRDVNAEMREAIRRSMPPVDANDL